ncbi:hypothetical protein [Thiolapillus sp.]|uniref:hypothetical protein n=3 Tax=Thiolapillus sp. TaxID=2017437 RepID=UPI003AF56028
MRRIRELVQNGGWHMVEDRETGTQRRKQGGKRGDGRGGGKEAGGEEREGEGRADVKRESKGLMR